MKGKDLTGKRFGKLTVLEPTDQRVRDAVVWRCRCECGNEILVESRRLKPGANGINQFALMCELVLFFQKSAKSSLG